MCVDEYISVLPMTKFSLLKVRDSLVQMVLRPSRPRALLSDIEQLPDRTESAPEFSCPTPSSNGTVDTALLDEEEHLLVNHTRTIRSGSAEAHLELPSKGSALHALGKCSPCSHHHKARGCHKGKECEFCHACTKEDKKAHEKKAKLARKAKASNYEALVRTAPVYDVYGFVVSPELVEKRRLASSRTDFVGFPPGLY